MKTIMLSGGLGNQMFQYAFYLSCKAKGMKCRIDVSTYKMARMHNGYELNRVFCIQEDIKKCSPARLLYYRFLYRLKPTFLVLQGPQYIYVDNVFRDKRPYLIGDWIHPNYFAGIEKKIIQTYTFRNISKENLLLGNKMKTESSVSIHIRRGDYLKIPNYCVCDDEYYSKAISLMCEKVANPFFYIFSNDPKWCKQFMDKFKVNYLVVESNQGLNSYQDMYLMTQCRHNIIANSTFSWWGAWLNGNQEKIVVAPKRWFRNSKRNANCEGWLLIDNV